MTATAAPVTVIVDRPSVRVLCGKINRGDHIGPIVPLGRAAIHDIAARSQSMSATFGQRDSLPDAVAGSDMRFLRIMLVLQVLLGLLWGVSMLVFARQIVLQEASGPHIEKIAMEGAAHMALVFGAVLVWRAPRRSQSALLLMIFLNGLWTLTDLVYIPLLGLSEIDFYAKVVVNAVLAIGLYLAGRRAAII
jgi:hypothetical protein